MNKDELWEIYTRKNPRFKSEGARFTASGLKKFFDQTWDTAHSQGVKNGKVLGAQEERKRRDPLGDFLKNFGGVV